MIKSQLDTTEYRNVGTVPRVQVATGLPPQKKRLAPHRNMTGLRQGYCNQKSHNASNYLH